MILWNDFILDDFLGPTLKFSEVCRSPSETVGELRSVMEDARTKIQETELEQRPARMVGLTSSDLTIPNGKEASSIATESEKLRQRGET